jgi:polysaccharide export outer membrane protein
MASLRKMINMRPKSDFKIYMLDDDIFYMNIFEQHLTNLGYMNVTAFTNPMDCYKNLSPPPDIIFYDHGIDFLKGLEVLKMIKRHNPDIYLIFICGADEVETVIQSLKHGAFDYFIKGENDVKNIEMVLTKIHRVRELLKKNNVVKFKRFHSFDL